MGRQIEDIKELEQSRVALQVLQVLISKDDLQYIWDNRTAEERTIVTEEQFQLLLEWWKSSR